MYAVFLCADDSGLVMSESDNFGGDGCSRTDTLGNDAVSETTILDSERWGETTVDCGINYGGNMG